jgi:hypothetical protein
MHEYVALNEVLFEQRVRGTVSLDGENAAGSARASAAFTPVTVPAFERSATNATSSCTFGGTRVRVRVRQRNARLRERSAAGERGACAGGVVVAPAERQSPVSLLWRPCRNACELADCACGDDAATRHPRCADSARGGTQDVRARASACLPATVVFSCRAPPCSLPTTCSCTRTVSSFACGRWRRGSDGAARTPSCSTTGTATWMRTLAGVRARVAVDSASQDCRGRGDPREREHAAFRATALARHPLTNAVARYYGTRTRQCKQALSFSVTFVFVVWSAGVQAACWVVRDLEVRVRVRRRRRAKLTVCCWLHSRSSD